VAARGERREDGDLGEFVRRVTTTHVRRWHLHRQSVGAGNLSQGTSKSFPIQMGSATRCARSSWGRRKSGHGPVCGHGSTQPTRRASQALVSGQSRSQRSGWSGGISLNPRLSWKRCVARSPGADRTEQQAGSGGWRPRWDWHPPSALGGDLGSGNLQRRKRDPVKSDLSYFFPPRDHPGAGAHRGQHGAGMKIKPTEDPGPYVESGIRAHRKMRGSIPGCQRGSAVILLAGSP
jgi:hypothetical protein